MPLDKLMYEIMGGFFTIWATEEDQYVKLESSKLYFSV